MSTEGIYGFYKNGMDKITYNPYSSLSDLGTEIIDFITTTSIKEMNSIFDKIILIDESDRDTLINMDNSIELYKEDLNYMVDNKDFIKQSLQCEWGYILNLDDNVLEVYIGFQKSPQENRYKINETNNGYYNCKLLKSIPLDIVNENTLMDIANAYNINKKK